MEWVWAVSKAIKRNFTQFSKPLQLRQCPAEIGHHGKSIQFSAFIRLRWMDCVGEDVSSQLLTTLRRWKSIHNIILAFRLLLTNDLVGRTLLSEAAAAATATSHKSFWRRRVCRPITRLETQETSVSALHIHFYAFPMHSITMHCITATGSDWKIEGKFVTTTGRLRSFSTEL